MDSSIIKLDLHQRICLLVKEAASLLSGEDDELDPRAIKKCLVDAESTYKALAPAYGLKITETHFTNHAVNMKTAEGEELSYRVFV